MERWTVRKDPGQLRPWRAWETRHRAQTERGFDSQWSAYAYALANADPTAELVA